MENNQKAKGQTIEAHSQQAGKRRGWLCCYLICIVEDQCQEYKSKNKGEGCHKWVKSKWSTPYTPKEIDKRHDEHARDSPATISPSAVTFDRYKIRADSKKHRFGTGITAEEKRVKGAITMTPFGNISKENEVWTIS